MPPVFTWIDKPKLAALAMPESVDDLSWLRRNGIDVLLSLSEAAPPRHWLNDAGLMGVHVPVEDMTAPTLRQLEMSVETITRAHKSGMGVAVHCAAGKGRTGTILAAYFVATGMPAHTAIEKVRELRPGSVETKSQESVIEEFATRRAPNIG